MSKFALDLSKFKKVSANAKNSMLQHQDGHRLVIDHSRLPKAMMTALERLPMADEGTQRFDEGGTAMPNPQPGPAIEEAPAEAAPTQAPDTQSPTVAQSESAPEKPEEDDSSEPVKPAASAAPAEAAAQAQAPQTEIQKAPGIKPPTTDQLFSSDKGANMQLVAQEDASIAHDLANQHIIPKTYSQLFADKSTLGKVSTIFGLMLGGIGSGLTGQENPIIGMMKNQISNDLDAQKQNVANTQTLLAMNRARIPDIQAATDFTRMQMNRMALHSLSEQVQKLPLGSPARAKAEQNLGLVGQFVNTENYALSDQIASKMAFLNSTQNQGDDVESQYQAKQRALVSSGNPALQKIAAFNDERHVPGVPGQSSVPVPQPVKDKIVAMNTLDAKAADLLNYAEAHKGSLSPSVRAAGKQKAEELLNFYNASIEGGVLTEGRLAWLDKQIKTSNPTSFFQDILGNNAKLREIKNSNLQRRDILLKSVGFKGGQLQGTPEAQTRVINGSNYQKVPGGWKKVQ